LKRGALVTAANWPVTVVQATANSLFKVLVAMPLVGGIFLVALVIGAEPVALMSLEWRDLAATIVASLLSRPAVLGLFSLSLALVVVGGSLFVVLVKGGTVGVLARGEMRAGSIERPPLDLDAVAGAAAFSIETFIEAARALFPRYARLGAVLIGVYLVSAAAYCLVVFVWPVAERWWATALLTAGFVGWITLVNFLYVLVQIVIAVDDCSVGTAARRTAAFLRGDRRRVAAVFFVVLALVAGATGASLVAAAALGVLTFVPLLGIAVLPVQLLAWLVRGLAFQFIDLAALSTYLRLYREGAWQRSHVRRGRRGVMSRAVPVAAR
jgi:hypothetical protein